MLLKSLPRVGLGLAALGRPGYINLDRTMDFHAQERSVEMMKTRAFAVLDAAFAAGVRYYDCARSYGLSEVFLRDWLVARSVSPEEVVIGSKWGYRYTADWQVDVPGGEAHEVKDHSLEHLLSQSAETWDILGKSGHLRLLQIHSATLESGVLDDDEVMQWMERIRSVYGWRLGLSVSGVAQDQTIRKAIKMGIFDTVQATFNIFEQSAGSALLAAHEGGMEVIIKEGMANGRVLDPEKAPALVAAAKQLGCSADALALAAIINMPFKPLVLSGAVTQAQLEDNYKAVEVAEALRGTDEIEKVMASSCIPAEFYWAERSELPWN